MRIDPNVEEASVQLGIVESSPEQRRSSEIGLSQIASSEIGALAIRSPETTSMQERMRESRVGQVCAAKIGASQLAMLESGIT